MGIFGALTTAVTGLRAQSFALENISGNIANSQTTAFKRVDTSFTDLIPDNPPSKQLSGTVQSYSRATNTVQGDLQNASISTFMAINGDGYFIVQKPDSFVDGQPVFAGTDLYTRRGDFQTNKDGYLVNGAGYYLMGIPIDATTGNLSGSVPQLLKFQNDFLPAQATTQVEYRANLASYPRTPNSDVDVPESELLNPATFQANPVAGAPTVAKLTSIGNFQPDAAATALGSISGLNLTDTLDGLGISNGDTITVNDGTTTYTYTVVDATTEDVDDLITAIAGGTAAVSANLSADGRIRIISDNLLDTLTIGGTAATEVGFAPGANVFQPTNLLTQGISDGDTLTLRVGSGAVQTITFGTGAGEIPTLTALQSDAVNGLPKYTGVISTVNTGTGAVTITASSPSDTLEVGGTAASLFGFYTTTALPANGTVIANDLTAFLDQSIGGGAITAYDVSGSPVNIQLRWAKVAGATYGGTDTWNLFYQVNSTATGTTPAWRNVGVNYAFGANGQMDPLIAQVTLNNVTINGISLGNLQLVHGSGGITQFSDPNGTAQVNRLSQNGFPAGSLETVAVSEKGRVVGTYTNGRTIDLAEITLANFNGANSLKRLDGGAFEATDESGPAILGAPGKIVGASLEGANTDIADEFTKLIVTQQAYSANTRIVTTANEMVQDLLNMIR
ncbi:MAG: flagellar hook-basal body complex protein [Xanthobacteraceae bacterium]|nr:flagellar hook-basal body complex protein [Xanthobacteraceae bacterium]